MGRLPWKTLRLPDLRDGDGERLWYAVSNNFKNNTRTSCANPGDLGCLNSDSRGTITVRNTAGTVIYDGSNPDAFTPSGVIAVIFSPGGILKRQGAAASQDRGCLGTGASCTAAGVCNSSLLTDTPKCNPVNYLDVLLDALNNLVEDNADFTNGNNTNGFINGVIRDAGGNVIVNDRLTVITYNDLMPVLQRRVAKEVLNCLTTYASVAQNMGRYPWAAPVATVTPPYADAYDTRFGRVPVTLDNTALGTSGGVANTSCPSTSPPTVCMSNSWPTACGITQGTWWTNWKEMVFYGVANYYRPIDPLLNSGVPAGSSCDGSSNCLLVDPPSTAVDKRVAVVVAGKRLSGVASGQPRTSVANKQNPANYLEGTNVNGATSYTYEVQPISASFNDFLLYQ